MLVFQVLQEMSRSCMSYQGVSSFVEKDRRRESYSTVVQYVFILNCVDLRGLRNWPKTAQKQERLIRNSYHIFCPIKQNRLLKTFQSQ